MLRCKVCSHKDASDSIAGVSTIEVSDMALKSIKKKCDEIHHHETSPGIHVSDESITFPPSKERRDIMTYRYPLDDLSSDSDFYNNSEV